MVTWPSILFIYLAIAVMAHLIIRPQFYRSTVEKTELDGIVSVVVALAWPLVLFVCLILWIDNPTAVNYKRRRHRRTYR